jgi:hypothetical protein
MPRLHHLFVVLALGLGAACSSSAKTSSQPAPHADPTSAPATPPATPAPATATKLGDKCGDGDSCTAPATCVSYSGIAGPGGPTFKTCEVKCKDDSGCPDGTHCRVVADGPGHVCR